MSSDDEASKKARDEDAAACGKLWEIYSKEAQNYDNGLIESWKADMDSVLIFSGLYSAILTAFVIESYQNLQPDPADSSALLLKRISQQLATPSNSSGFTPFPDDELFTPTSSALACNILWFISLALALTCAFLATLVQQWSRRFLHRTTRAQSPGVHAHLLQYLYFGLKDLKMHAVVDLIPSLLHLSLFSFFAGLIGFLRDVNSVLTWLFAIALGIVLLIYFTFTLVPLVYLDSPYSTPLSPVLWQIWQVLGAISRTRAVRAVWDWLSQITPQVLSAILRPLRIRAVRVIHAVWNWLAQIKPQVLTLWDWLSRIRTSNDEEAQSESIAPDVQNQEPQQPSSVTLTLNVQTSRLSLIGASLEESKKRRPINESRCIIWTLNSLNDDKELLPFLEALPYVLLGDGLDCVREGNFHLVSALASKTDIVSRTLSLMENATNSWHEKNHRTRCAIAGVKTLYSLAFVLVDQKFRGRLTHPEKWSSPFTGKLARIARKELFRTEESKPFYNSVVALCILSVLQSLNDWIQADQPIHHSQFQEVVTLLESRSPFGVKKSGYNFENEPSGEQAKSAIKEMIPAAFYGYLRHTIYRSSSNLVQVSKQMLQDGSDFLQVEEDPGYLFHYLASHYISQRPNERADSLERMDTIFRIGFDGFISFTLAKGSENDQQKTLREISYYIATRFSVGGWGSTKELWSGSERLLKLLGCLRQSEASLNDVSDSALQELLLHAGHEDEDVVVPFLEHGLSHIYAQSKEENTPKSHRWFLIVLIILYKFDHYDHKERFSSILDQINGELPVDPEWNDISPCPHIENEGHLRLTVILYCLDSKLPANNTRDILHLFFHCFSYEHHGSLGRQPNLLNELVKHSEHFATQFLGTPSKESMDITAMVWGLLWEVLRSLDPGLDNAREAWEAVRLGLKSLSNAADKLLSPDGRKTVDEEIKKSTPEQKHTILHEYLRNRLDLLEMVKRVQEWLPMILEEIDRVHPPTTASPSSSNTVNQETELAVDDHNTGQATDLPQVPNVTLTPAAPFKAEVESEPLLHWGCI